MPSLVTQSKDEDTCIYITRADRYLVLLSLLGMWKMTYQ